MDYNKMNITKWVRVKSLGNVPVEAFPKNYVVKDKDGNMLTPSEIPISMTLQLNDEKKVILIRNMKLRGLKLIDESECQLISGKSFRSGNLSNGTKILTEQLPAYQKLRNATNEKSHKKRIQEKECQPLKVLSWNNIIPVYKSNIVDKYYTYKELSKDRKEGLDYRIEYQKGESDIIIVAIHGGNIEASTTELAQSIAGNVHSYYSFTSLMPLDNAQLHITSTAFDEPIGCNMVSDAITVISLHGAADKDKMIYLGGRDKVLKARIETALKGVGFDVGRHTNQDLSGTFYSNIVNRGLTGAGVQFELGRNLREKFFEGGLCDRSTPTHLFYQFIDTIRSTIDTYRGSIEEQFKELVDRWNSTKKILNDTNVEYEKFIRSNFIQEHPKEIKISLAKKNDAADQLKEIKRKIKRLVDFHFLKSDAQNLEIMYSIIKEIMPTKAKVINHRMKSL